MKPWIIFFIMSTISTAFANCNVFIPEKTFYHASGYGINFDFTEKLSSKGYYEVLDPNEANFILEIKGTEIKGRLNKAQAKIMMGEMKVIELKTCLSQMCSIYDYGKAFNKAYASFFLNLSNCNIYHQ